ncbi:unnamed protein product [Lasius platythorax]|uniref:Uncharacterized protein n=1 Tax=Lasius platythorax TaxID=488582 RepID=A0AAV2N6N3_9HYME
MTAKKDATYLSADTAGLPSCALPAPLSQCASIYRALQPRSPEVRAFVEGESAVAARIRPSRLDDDHGNRMAILGPANIFG